MPEFPSHRRPGWDLGKKDKVGPKSEHRAKPLQPCKEAYLVYFRQTSQILELYHAANLKGGPARQLVHPASDSAHRVGLKPDYVFTSEGLVLTGHINPTVRVIVAIRLKWVRTGVRPQGAQVCANKGNR